MPCKVLSTKYHQQQLAIKQKEHNMIPLSTSTTLSIEKAAKLLQNLVDLRDKRNKDLPEDISKSIESLLQAQKRLTKDIDKFMQKNVTSKMRITLKWSAQLSKHVQSFLLLRIDMGCFLVVQ